MPTSNSKKLIIKIPGKLILSGEWSVLELGNPCIVLPINKYLTVQIQPHKKIIIDLKELNLKNIESTFDRKKLLIQNGHI